MRTWIGVVLAVVIGSGCATMNKYGIGRNAVEEAIWQCLEKEGATDAMSRAELAQLVTIIDDNLSKDAALQTLSETIAARSQNQARIQQYVNKYYANGKVTVFTPAPAVTNHIVTQIKTWYGGEDLSQATVDTSFQLTVSNDGKTWSAAPSGWPTKDDNGDTLNVMCCAAYQNAAGEWVGGKFEWNRPSPSPRSFKHITDGYNGWVAPPSGTELRVWCASVDKQMVSTEAKAIYK